MRKAVRIVGLVAVALASAASSGCLAVALGTAAAAGGAAGYVYLRGNVWQEYPTDFTTTWVAAHAALLDLGLPVTGVKRDTETEGTLTGQTGSGEEVSVSLETRASKAPADGPITRVMVRVGLLGDRTLSERLLDRVHARLGQPPQVIPGAPVPAEGSAPQPNPVQVVPAGAAFPQTPPPPLAAPGAQGQNGQLK